MAISLGHDANEQRAEIVLIGLSVTASGKILVDASDTLSGYLADKLKAGANIQLVIEDVGGNEKLRVDIGSAIATKAYADSGDASTLNSSKAYTDTGDADTLVAANLYTDGHALPSGSKGDALLHNGSGYVSVSYGEFDINGNANQAPAVTDGHVFFVNASSLTNDRTITPDPVGALESEGITIVVKDPGVTFNYSLVADRTVVLDSKIMVELTMVSGMWTIVQFRPYTGNL